MAIQYALLRKGPEEGVEVLLCVVLPQTLEYAHLITSVLGSPLRNPVQF